MSIFGRVYFKEPYKMGKARDAKKFTGVLFWYIDND